MWGSAVRHRRYLSTLAWVVFAVPALVLHYGGWAKVVVLAVTLVVCWGAWADYRRARR